MSKPYKGQSVMPKKSRSSSPATDFDKGINEKKPEIQSPGVERSRSPIDLRSARAALKKWQKPFRKV